MGGVLAWETAPPKRTALELETMVKVCPNLGLGTSPDVFTFYDGSDLIQKLTFNN